MEIKRLYVTRLRRAVAWSIATLLLTTPFSAQNQDSPLIDAAERLRGIEGIGLVHLGKTDIVRHPLVQNIVQVYGGADSKG